MKTFIEANKVLAQYVSKKNLKDVYTLGRMKKMMDALGNPQDKLKVIHVAGTSGKTSTCYYIAEMLKAAGQKTGLTISPHIDQVNERVQINLTPLPEAEFCSNLGEFIKAVDKTGIKPTYFELLMAFAYWYFAKEKVDYAVIEVGLGGLLDGSNVVTRADKVCVITDIGLDHVEVLGPNLTDIAIQKAGIIKPGNSVFTNNQTPEVLVALKQAALTQQADLTVVPNLEDQDHDLDELPIFQRRNWWLAFTIYDYLVERDSLPILTPLQLRASMRAYIPARMEIVEHAGKKIILDGAHNAQKMQLLGESIKEKFPGAQIATLLAIKENPNFSSRVDLKPVSDLSNHVIVTTFSGQQDLPFKSVNPEEITRHLKTLNAKDVEVINDPADAFKALLKQPEEILLVTGSFYLMGQIRQLITH